MASWINEHLVLLILMTGAGTAVLCLLMIAHAIERAVAYHRLRVDAVKLQNEQIRKLKVLRSQMAPKRRPGSRDTNSGHVSGATSSASGSTPSSTGAAAQPAADEPAEAVEVLETIGEGRADDDVPTATEVDEPASRRAA